MVMIGEKTVNVVPSALQLPPPKDIDPEINPAMQVEAQHRAMKVVLNFNIALATI